MVTLQSNFVHQQKSPDGYRLLHYSLDHFFTPTLSLTLERHSHRIPMGWSLGNLLLLLLWIFPAVLTSVLLVNLGTEFKHMRQSVDRLAVRDFDPPEIPAPLMETIFVTTTVFSPSPSVATEVDNVSTQTTTPLFTSSVSIITAASTAAATTTRSTSTLSTSDQTQIDMASFTSTPTPSTSPLFSENSLLPVSALPFEWSKFWIEYSPVARKTVDRILEGLGIVWQTFRKVYHYPLDPP